MTNTRAFSCKSAAAPRRRRELAHGLGRLGLLLVPLFALFGCTGAPGEKAPGLAGTQTPDPVTLDYPLAYVKRPVPTADIDVRDLITATPGGDLFVRSQASAGGIETNVTKVLTKGVGDVRDPDVSPDGTRVVFAMRLLDPTLPADSVKQPTWNVWEYNSKDQSLRRIISDDVTAEEGHDVGPHYLPDGRIVFASTRQDASRAILLNEGRPQYQGQTDAPSQATFELHVMNADGSGIHQISFNTDHDFAPSVLNSGQIVFSRWENVNGSARINLYRTNPDGTGMELYYGQYSHTSSTDGSTVQFLAARARPDGKLVSIVRPFVGTQLGGDIALVDAENFVEINQPTLANAGAAGPAQTPATNLNVTTTAGQPSLGGRFASVYPLFDGTGRLLVSWSPCLVLVGAATQVCTADNSSGPGVTLAPPEYTIWVYDTAANTLQPLASAEPGIMIIDPVILQARAPAPTVIHDQSTQGTLDQNLVDNGVGLLVIRSVYDFDGIDTTYLSIATLADPKLTSADQRPYRFIRIEKPVEQPDPMVRRVPGFAFGPAGLGMRDILAYAPIEPDGSIKIQVPANVPFALELLDKNGRRVGPRHASWMQLLPGEVRTCNGCHDSSKNISHGRAGLSKSVNLGAPVQGLPFPDTTPAWTANIGEIMAETRTRITCPTQIASGCATLPGADLVYVDVWTDPLTAGRPPDASFAYKYEALNTAAPIRVSANCLPVWSAQCRMTIHYPLHLQPIWNWPRQTFAADGVTLLSDNTCVLCHSPKDATGAAQVPAAQLDLTNSASSADANVFTSYTDLLFSHDQQQLIMGALQDVVVTGQPPVMVPGVANAGSANLSTSFFNVFAPGGAHSGYLSTAELRLISEWLDIGAQYYNDPFVAPAAN